MKPKESSYRSDKCKVNIFIYLSFPNVIVVVWAIPSFISIIGTLPCWLIRELKNLSRLSYHLHRIIFFLNSLYHKYKVTRQTMALVLIP